MEASNNNQEKIKVFVNDNDSINQVGCSFFTDALNSPITFVSSNQLRWFTYQFKDPEMKKIQDEAKEKIKSEANKMDKSHTFEMHILLYSTLKSLMTVESSEYIKYLLQCNGVEIHCLEPPKDQRLRISYKGTRLFLSMSREQEKQVCEGILYEAENEESPLSVYFRERFKQDFNRAKKVILDNKGMIVYADNWKERLRIWLKSDRGINIISLWIGIVGAIMTTVASLIAIFECFSGY